VTPALVIARVTILESSRRKLLLALVILTAIVITGTAWGFDRLWTIRQGGRLIGPTEVHLVAAALLIVIAFMFSAVLALSASLVGSPAISADVESGLTLSILSRPVRRSDLVLGKWLGLGLLVVVERAFGLATYRPAAAAGPGAHRGARRSRLRPVHGCALGAHVRAECGDGGGSRAAVDARLQDASGQTNAEGCRRIRARDERLLQVGRVAS